MIWNLLCSDYLFVSAILLYHSNHSLESSASIPPNSIGLTWFDSLLTWLIPRLASVKAFTSAATFGFNPPAFSSGGGLKPFSNPSPNPGGRNGDGLLLLLFSGGGLLLPLPKAPNPPLNPDGELKSPLMVPKYRKCFPPVFTLLVTLFWRLLPPAVVPVVILIG